jgi:Cdc6-like AAA superfamily ATPase
LEPDDIRELRSRITLNITYLNSFREGFTRDNVVKLVKLQDQLVERQEQQQILDWLTPIDYGVQQYDIGRRRQAGTGQWLLQSPEYQQWLTKEKEILFCPGIPGAGKTILTSTVVDNLFELYRTDQSVGICYIFFNFHRNSEQKLDDLIASLLKQLGQTRPDLFGSVKLLYDGHKERRTRPSLDELCRALHSVVTGHSRVFVVIDALDECQTFDNCRSRFISELLNLWSRPGVSIFATSRFIPDIMARFEDAMVKEIRASDHDIVKFLDGNLPYLPGLVSRDITLQAEIKQAIVQCVDGM